MKNQSLMLFMFCVLFTGCTFITGDPVAKDPKTGAPIVNSEGKPVKADEKGNPLKDKDGKYIVAKESGANKLIGLAGFLDDVGVPFAGAVEVAMGLGLTGFLAYSRKKNKAIMVTEKQKNNVAYKLVEQTEDSKSEIEGILGDGFQMTDIPNILKIVRKMGKPAAAALQEVAGIKEEVKRDIRELKLNKVLKS